MNRIADATHSFARRLVTSSMSRAARVTFRVAFFGRIRFSPNYHKECQLSGKKVIMGEELTTTIQT